ncbi:MAG: hypothetical protein IJO04_02050 [Oscillospiraceae bacterium]|nr:hypothetical protein [Oscillospiraceae bacterium]
MLKKILPVLICAITIFSSFNGCSREIKYDAYTTLQCGTAEADAVWPEPRIADYTGPSEVSVTVNGVQYVGSYKKSDPSLPFYYDTDHVFVGSDFEFHIRESDGKFTYLHVENPESSGSPLDESRLRQIADSVADDYVSLRKCTVEKEGKCNYRYYRVVQGYVTEEWVLIQLNSNGNVVGVILSDPDAFDNVKNVEIDEEKANKSVEEKVNEICKSIVPDGWKSRYNIRSRSLIKTANNQCALQYDVNIDYESANGLGRGGRLVSLLVIVDHEKYNPFKP